MTPRFRVAGFPVRIHPLFLLTTLATGASGGWNPARMAVWCGVVFVSVLVHELGHALAFRRYGHGAEITLHGLGGTATSTGGPPLTHRRELWLALAGPGAGFLLGGVVLGLQQLTPLGQAGGLVGYAVRGLLWANFGYGLLNLLPIHPLDGGHAMAAVVRERGGHRFEWLIHGISLGTAAAALVLAVVGRQLWLGMFALVLGVLNVGPFLQAWAERRYRLRIRAAKARARPAVSEHEAAAAIQGFLSRLGTAPRERPAAPPPPEEHGPAPPPDRQFLGQWLLENGLMEWALPPLRAAFAQAPTPRTGHALATALLEAGRHAEVARLLSSPDAHHLGQETLTLIATRAEAAGQLPLATRARELHQLLASAPPLAHDSEKQD